MFSNTLSFLSSRNVSDQVSHPYTRIGKIISVYNLLNLQSGGTAAFEDGTVR